MEKNQNSLRKFSNVIYVFAKIGFVAAIVGVCLSACAIIFLAITGKMDFSVSLGENVILHGLFAEADAGENLAVVCGGLSYSAVSCAFLIVVMRILMRMFANMRDNYTPFIMENAGLFKKMAIWMIVNSIVPAIVGQTVGNACSKMMQLPFNMEFGNSFSLIAVLILFAMSMVFKYGCSLQEQADTTL